MAVILNGVQRHWVCPNCDATAVTIGEPNRFHPCPKMHGMSTPMVPEGVVAKVEAHEREDYIRDELVQVDDEGRPIMAISVTRDEGEDRVVFAPAARSSAESLETHAEADDPEALREAARAEARRLVEGAITKLEKQRQHVAGAEEALDLARAALAEIEQA